MSAIPHYLAYLKVTRTQKRTRHKHPHTHTKKHLPTRIRSKRDVRRVMAYYGMPPKTRPVYPHSVASAPSVLPSGMKATDKLFTQWRSLGSGLLKPSPRNTCPRCLRSKGGENPATPAATASDENMVSSEYGHKNESGLN